MSSILLNYAGKLKAPPPVFKLFTEYNNQNIRSSLAFEPEKNVDPNDPLSVIVANNYSHSLDYDRKEMVVFVDSVAQNALADVISCLRSFYLNNSPLKEPRSSKLCKWLFDYNIGDVKLNDGMVLLYRYTYSFCPDFTKSSKDNSEHKQNVLTMLEIIRNRNAKP